MDFDQIFKLLHIEEKTRNYPMLKAIHDKVMEELKNHAEGIVKVPENQGQLAKLSQPPVAKGPSPFLKLPTTGDA